MHWRIYYEVYGKKARHMSMLTISMDYMNKFPEYFAEAKEICEEFGLL
jgi:hypothetical protein